MPCSKGSPAAPLPPAAAPPCHRLPALLPACPPARPAARLQRRRGRRSSAPRRSPAATPSRLWRRSTCSRRCWSSPRGWRAACCPRRASTPPRWAGLGGGQAGAAAENEAAQRSGAHAHALHSSFSCCAGQPPCHVASPAPHPCLPPAPACPHLLPPSCRCSCAAPASACLPLPAAAAGPHRRLHPQAAQDQRQLRADPGAQPGGAGQSGGGAQGQVEGERGGGKVVAAKG